MKKIGILGGSFNPIHNGHIMLGRTAHEQFNMDKILVMPNKVPYYKEKPGLTDIDRCNLIKLAIHDIDYMEFSDIDLKRGGITYTIDTMHYLLDNTKDIKYFFIIGGDSLANLFKWKNINELFKCTSFLCSIRNEIDLKSAENIISTYKKNFDNVDISLMETENIDISSSDIRERIKNGESIEDMVPNQVLQYINDKKLYV